jgi:hypothetical protein
VTETASGSVRRGGVGGAHGIERMPCDARAPIIMAPTTDQLYDFIGRAVWPELF